MTNVKGVYHFNPLDPKKVAETAKKYQVTAFPTTPTFLRKYLRRSSREDYEFINTIVCGAEKLPTYLIDAWEEKFGVRPVEGYGATELSPVVSTNVPKGRRADYLEFLREGTIGRPLVNLLARVVKPESINNKNGKPPEVLPNDGETPGMLQIKGQSVMKGYYKDAEKTAEVIQDGWYSTGDIATIDKEGFIKIVGRESRISKIAGEMVPHILIEDEINKIIAEQQTDENGEVRIAVSAVPNEQKGERLVILHTELPQTPEEICKALRRAGLPNHWVPSPNDFYRIETIPVLGTGKLDLRAVKDLAMNVV
jgi:acyl-[acyl-carrier-protein]-phospholipid O-acyltransferase/long-chain-fatty-acid--[acyl-carrier-protein] ligase